MWFSVLLRKGTWVEEGYGIQRAKPQDMIMLSPMTRLEEREKKKKEKSNI